MILVNDPFDQSCRSKISSTCFICNRVTIRKSVFRSLHDQSIFLAMSFKVSNAQYTEILNYWSSWFMLSIIRVFFTLGILVYSRELVCVQHIRNITADSLSRTTSRHVGFYYIMNFSTMEFYGFHQPWFTVDWSIIDYLSSLYIIQNEVLTAYLHKQTLSQYYYGTGRGCIYATEVQRCLSLELAVQFRRTAHSYTYLDWHNPHSYPFVFISPLNEIARTQFL